MPNPKPPKGIFVSYRRSNASAYAGRIGDRLRDAYPGVEIFMDVESIDAGSDFEAAIADALSGASHLIALVARDKDGRDSLQRLHVRGDFVRLEIAEALKRELTVIPALLDGASMPDASDLPPDIAEFAKLNAVEIRHSRFEDDVANLIRAIGGGRLPGDRPPFRPIRAFLGWAAAGALAGLVAAVIANAVTGQSLAYILGGRYAAVISLPALAVLAGLFGVFHAKRRAGAG